MSTAGKRTINAAKRLALIAVLLSLVLIPSSSGQRRLGRPAGQRNPALSSLPEVGEFTFVRAIYESPYSGWRGGSWTIDYPEADEHLIGGIHEWAGTNLNISARPEKMKFTDERIFDYPLIYIVEPGYMELSTEEAAALREYILRGGSLFLDDFHGEYEWQNVQEQMRKVLPEYEIKDLPLTHPIFHCYFDIDTVEQVPGIGSWLYRGVTHEKGGIVPRYMGIEDNEGRVVAFFTRNCDLGDAWEWIDDPSYPLKYGAVAYKVAMNVVIYAMSH